MPVANQRETCTVFWSFDAIKTEAISKVRHYCNFFSVNLWAFSVALSVINN